MRSEERRALVLLGITAILASFYSAMLATVWSSKGNLNDTSFVLNLPGNSPTRHATFYWMPILQYMIAFWMLYAFFIFWYFSADWLSWKVREVVRGIATVFMGFYFLYISAYVPLTTFIVVWIIDPTLQAIALLFAVLFLFTLEVDFLRFVMIGRTIFIPTSLRKIVRWLKAKRQRPVELPTEGESEEDFSIYDLRL